MRVTVAPGQLIASYPKCECRIVGHSDEAGLPGGRVLLDALMAAVVFGCHRYLAEQLRRLGADACRVSDEVLALIKREEDRLADAEVRPLRGPDPLPETPPEPRP